MKANGLNLIHVDWPNEYEPEEICTLGEWSISQYAVALYTTFRTQRRQVDGGLPSCTAWAYKTHCRDLKQSM